MALVVTKNTNWLLISISTKLSEEFIREFFDKVDWGSVSQYQKLSEGFIREFSDKVNWNCISKYQKLSEGFIREFSDKVNWYCISMFQKLSEGFIREFVNKVSWKFSARYQNLSEEFRKEFNLEVPKTCWLYKTQEWKEKYIREHTGYEIEDGMVIAYKSCRSDGYSVYNFQYHYEVGNEYDSAADYNEDMENSFGLSAWTREGALDYCKEKLFKVGIKFEDVACIVHNGNKIRAAKIKILEEIKV